MRTRLLALILTLSLLLGGCGWFDTSYVNVTPYQQQSGTAKAEVVSASNYYQLRTALEDVVSSGAKSSVIYIANYDPELVERNLEDALRYIREYSPIGAYAVADITCEVGTSSGKPAIAIQVSYRRGQSEIRRIVKVTDAEAAKPAIADALQDFDASLTLEVEYYTDTDFVRVVEAYAEENPEYVLELPLVTEDVFGQGVTRIVELSFSYQNNRDSLKQMKYQVQPIFDSAALYVTTAAEERQKYSQLYSFLMERFDYTLETSITPAYSLLCHGVGDSRAFAVVYASMCRRAGLNCRIVTGTRNGEPWTWNMVMDRGNYYHVDLIRSSANGSFAELVDSDMGGYVWDYSGYPQCVKPYTAPAEVEMLPAAPTQATEPEPTEAEKNPE